MVTHQKEVLEAVHDGVDGEDRLPVLPQDIEAHVALQVDVGMVHLGLALYLEARHPGERSFEDLSLKVPSPKLV